MNPALAQNANIPSNMSPAHIPGAAAAAAAQMQAANQLNPMNQMANKQQMARNQPAPNAMYQGNAPNHVCFLCFLHDFNLTG